MTKTEELKPQDSVQESLQKAVSLLHKQQLAEQRARKQEMSEHEPAQPPVPERQHLAELQKLLDEMHPADVAYILEALPLDQRLVVWNLVKTERDGEILLEVSDAVRDSLIRAMDSHELVAATEQLDTDEIADLVPDLPEEVVADVFKRLSAEEREELRAAISYPEGTVGALMDFEMVTIREDVTLEVVLRYLRLLD